MSACAVTADLLSHLQPLASLGHESLLQAVALAHQESHVRGKEVNGLSVERKLVYLLKGELKLEHPNGCVKVLVGGCDDAVYPLTWGGRQVKGIQAITDIELIWFDEGALDIVVTWDQIVPVDQPRTGESGLSDVRRLALSAFANLPPAHIESLLSCFRSQLVKSGEIIVRQGDPGEHYYLIEYGRALVTREIAGANMELAELKAGDTFGEEALLAEASRNATVIMKTDGGLLCLDRADFIRLLREPLLQRVNGEEAFRRVNAGAVWLDVRFPAEYQQDGLPDAINIPLNLLREAMPSMQRETEYMVYCQSGRRSSAAVFLMSQHGLSAVLLDGGLKAIMNSENAAL